MPPDSRERILNDAAGLFLQYGFKRTTMEDIASRVGISKGSLYLHFENKDAIFGAVIDREAEAILRRLREIESAVMPADKKLASLLMEMLTMLWDFCHQAPHAPDIWAETLPSVRDRIVPARRQAEQIYAAVIRAGQREGLFASDLNAEQVAPLVRLALAGLNVPYVEIATREELLEQAPLLVDLLIRGLRYSPGRAATKDMKTHECH